MDDLFQTFGDEVAALLRHPAVTLMIQLIAAYLVIVWLAAAYWTFRDLHQRTRDPFTPYLAAAGVLVFTPIAFPLALLAYRVVRPPETLAERRTRDLEAYVLTAEVTKSSCATCGGSVDDAWMRCPACGKQLADSCRSCGGRIEPDWSVCAWCARDLEPFGEPAVESPPLPVPVVASAVDDPATDEGRGAIPGWRLEPDRDSDTPDRVRWGSDPARPRRSVPGRPLMAGRAGEVGMPAMAGGPARDVETLRRPR